MSKLILFFIYLLPLYASAQNLTGTWIGDEGKGTFLKLVIVHIGDSCYGYTYDEGGGGYCRATFAGAYQGKNKLLRGRGLVLSEATADHELAAYKLNYSRRAGEDYLTGSVTGQSFLSGLLSIGSLSAATLKRVTEVVDSTPYIMSTIRRLEDKIIDGSLVRPADPIIAKTVLPPITTTSADTIKSRPMPISVNEDKAARKTKIIDSITTSADTLQMTLFDNGVMDHDTVTVFFDNTIILNQTLITVQGKTIVIPVPKDGQSHQITLFANNLGTIPPNTAFLVIYAGTQRHELRAAFDLQTNAAIMVKYVKE